MNKETKQPKPYPVYGPFEVPRGYQDKKLVMVGRALIGDLGGDECIFVHPVNNPYYVLIKIGLN